MSEIKSLKVVNRYNSDVVLHDSKDYPEFSGDVWNDFVLFLVIKKANLSYADLSYANLFKADLSYANLFKANLFKANLSKANLLNSSRNKIKGINCLEFNFDDCFSFILVKNRKTSQLQIGCKRHSLEEWKEEFNENNNYVNDCNDEDHYNLHKDKFFKYLPLFEEFLKEN